MGIYGEYSDIIKQRDTLAAENVALLARIDRLTVINAQLLGAAKDMEANCFAPSKTWWTKLEKKWRRVYRKSIARKAVAHV